MTERSEQEHRARPAEPQDEAYLANVWKVYLLHFLMHFQLWWSIWVLYLKDMRGFSLTQIAILEALFFGLTTIAIQAVTPANPARVLVANLGGFAIWAIVLGLLVSSDSFLAPGVFLFDAPSEALSEYFSDFFGDLGISFK